MFCSKCGANNESSSKFCKICGAPLGVSNPISGNKVEKRANKSRHEKKGLIVGLIVAALVLAGTGITTGVVYSLQFTAYTLNPQTVTYLKSIHQKITIDILANEQDMLQSGPYAVIVEAAQAYIKENPDITIRYIDISKDTAYIKKYKDLKLNTGDLMVSCENRYKHISIDDLTISQADSKTGVTNLTSCLAEQQIDTALLYVTTANPPTVVFTSGHGESTDVSNVQEVLASGAYGIETNGDLADIDKNAAALVIFDPTSDFTSSEIQQLDNFLNNGGAMGKGLFVCLDVRGKALPNLEAYLKEWNIGVGTGVVYDETNDYSNTPFVMKSDAISSGVFNGRENKQTAIVADARPLTLLSQARDGFSSSAILSTLATSRLWTPSIVTNEAANSFKPSDSDQKGPFTILAESVHTTTQNSTTVHSCVVVSGSAAMFSDNSILSESSTNSSLLFDCVNNLAGVKQSFNIPSLKMVSFK